jgi:hypothetical protein
VSSTTRLPKRLPVGTKYVVESAGSRVRRFVELPNGKRISLPTRKAFVRKYVDGVSIVPGQVSEDVEA